MRNAIRAGADEIAAGLSFLAYPSGGGLAAYAGPARPATLHVLEQPDERLVAFGQRGARFVAVLRKGSTSA
jgi:hypothetical protein